VSVDFRLLLRAFDGPPGIAPDTAAEHDPKETLRLFGRAARLEPTDPDYHYILGLGLARAGRFAEATASFREAISFHTEDPDYRFACGAALWNLGRNDEAAEAFREALRLRPGDAAALNGLACALTRLGRNTEAVAAVQEAIRHGGRQGDFYVNLGIALWQHGREADALQAFQRAVSLDAASHDVRRNLGLALAGSGRRPEALETFRHLARERPRDAFAQLDLAEALFDVGRLAEAERALDTALDLDAAAIATRPRCQEIRNAVFARRGEDERRAAASPLLWRLLGRLRLPSSGTRRSLNLTLIAAVAAAYAAYRVLPPYVTRHLFADDVARIAGTPLPGDDEVRERLRHAVRERGLDAQVRDDACEIDTRPRWRRIVCRYDVPVSVAPGVGGALRFVVDVERPYLLPGEVIHAR
jgi:Flp pilus assembly protein TadD